MSTNCRRSDRLINKQPISYKEQDEEHFSGEFYESKGDYDCECTGSEFQKYCTCEAEYKSNEWPKNWCDCCKNYYHSPCAEKLAQQLGYTTKITVNNKRIWKCANCIDHCKDYQCYKHVCPVCWDKDTENGIPKRKKKRRKRKRKREQSKSISDDQELAIKRRRCNNHTDVVCAISELYEISGNFFLNARHYD